MAVEEVVRQAVADVNVDADIVKVTDMQEIIAHDVLKTPGLWIGGKLVSSGRIPAPATVAAWIRESSSDGGTLV